MRIQMLWVPVPQRVTAALAQLGERQTEDLKVPGSIPGLGISFFFARSLNSAWRVVFSLVACTISSFKGHGDGSADQKLFLRYGKILGILHLILGLISALHLGNFGVLGGFFVHRNL